MKPKCKFYEVAPASEDGFAVYRCEVCHRRPVRILATDPARIYANCLPPQTVVQKLTRLCKEVVAWISAGSPTRSSAEIARIYTDFCQPCENFKAAANGGTCTLCSCAMKKRGLVNKISLATSHCPIGKW